MLALGLAALAGVCGLGCLAVAIWIVAPAPNGLVAFETIRIGEHSLWLVIASLAGIALAALAWRLSAPLAVCLLAVLVNGAAAGIGGLPGLQASQIAAAHGLRLDLARTLRDPVVPPGEPKTFQHADAEDGLSLDVFEPPPAVRSTQLGPAVVAVHGGGWSGGGRGDDAAWHVWLANHGAVVFAIEYRLRSQPNWSAVVQDVADGVGWVERNAARFGADPTRIVLVGRSAGGHLALMAAYSRPINVRGVVSLYAPTDLEYGVRQPGSRGVFDLGEAIDAFAGSDLQAASPMAYVGADVPRTLLIQGGRDQLVSVEHERRLAQALRQAGARVEVVELPWAQHGFDLVFDGWGGQLLQGLLLEFVGLSGGPTR